MIFFRKRQPEDHTLYPMLQQITKQQDDLVTAIQSLTQVVETLSTRVVATNVTNTKPSTLPPTGEDQRVGNIGIFQVPDSISETIELVDWLLLARSEANEAVKPILDRILSRLRTILESSDITVLEEKGLFDASLHKVVHVLPTNDPEIENTIAEVVRPGYAMNERIIRSQEVIIYHKTQK